MVELRRPFRGVPAKNFRIRENSRACQWGIWPIEESGVFWRELDPCGLVKAVTFSNLRVKTALELFALIPPCDRVHPSVFTTVKMCF